jgi:hypothetical protein
MSGLLVWCELEDSVDMDADVVVIAVVIVAVAVVIAVVIAVVVVAVTPAVAVSSAANVAVPSDPSAGLWRPNELHSWNKENSHLRIELTSGSADIFNSQVHYRCLTS